MAGLGGDMGKSEFVVLKANQICPTLDLAVAFLKFMEPLHSSFCFFFFFWGGGACKPYNMTYLPKRTLEGVWRNLVKGFSALQQLSETPPKSSGSLLAIRGLNMFHA